MFTIEALFRGGHFPVEQRPNSEEYYRISQMLEECTDRFASTLSDEQRVEFEKLGEFEAQRSLEELTAAYQMGFRMATQL